VVTDSKGAHVLLGDVYGHVWEWGVGTVDGGHDEPSLVISDSGATETVVPLAGTPGLTPGALSGVPAWVVSPGGDFRRVRIVDNDAAELTLSHLDDPIAEDSQILIGGVLFWVESGWYTMGDPAAEKVMEAIRFAHEEATAGT